MPDHADKIQDSHHKLTGHQHAKSQEGGNANPPLADNRPEAQQLARLREILDNSPQTKQAAHLQTMINNSPLMAAQRQQINRTLGGAAHQRAAVKEVGVPIQDGSVQARPRIKARRALANAAGQNSYAAPRGTDIVAQRIVRFKGVDYRTPKDLWNSDAYYYAKEHDISMSEVNALVKDPVKIYDLENGLALIKEPVKMTQEQLEITAGKAATTETKLEKNTQQFKNEKTYNVTIDEGAAFLKGGPIELLGTGGLNGCVAVMIECENRGKTAYFLAHVSSHLAGEMELVQAEVNRILYSLKQAVGEEIEWSAFSDKKENKNKLLLARSPSESQELFVNMRTILAKSGAKMLATLHTNVTIDFSGDQARFLGNEAPKFGVSEPSLSLENAEEKEYGYGQSRTDATYITWLNNNGYEKEADAEIERIAIADDLKGLSPEEREKELLYQQYARDVGDI